MNLTAEDVTEFAPPDLTDDEENSLDDALAELAVDVELDAVESVREVREDP